MTKKAGDNKWQSATILRHAGSAQPEFRGAVNPPLYRASTVLFESWAELKTAAAQPFDQFYYGRFGTPTHEALNEVLCEMSGAEGCAWFPSGLATIAGVILSFVQAGDEVLVADCVYGPTRKFCDQQLNKLGVRTRYFPADAGEDIAEYLSAETALIFCESPGSLGMEMQDLPAIIHQAGDIPVVVDNTWGTPLYSRVLEMGAAVDIQSATKYLAGHADLLLGVALCAPHCHQQVRKTALSYGYCVSPDDAWQCLRGLRSLDVRMQQHAANAQRLKQWFAQQPEVQAILDPAWPDHAQHSLWQRDIGQANGLFSVQFAAMSDAQMTALVDELQLFGLGFSWGGYESLVLPFKLQGLRDHPRLPTDSSYVRFHAGLEDPQDLIADLEQGFSRMRSKR